MVIGKLVRVKLYQLFLRKEVKDTMSKRTYLVNNEFVGIVLVTVSKDTEADCREYVDTIYGHHFIPCPKRIEKALRLVLREL